MYQQNHKLNNLLYKVNNFSILYSKNFLFHKTIHNYRLKEYKNLYIIDKCSSLDKANKSLDIMYTFSKLNPYNNFLDTLQYIYHFFHHIKNYHRIHICLKPMYYLICIYRYLIYSLLLIMDIYIQIFIHLKHDYLNKMYK